MVISFEIPGQPQGKARAKVSTVGGFARAYTPEKTAIYENLIKLSFKSKCPNIQPIECAVKMQVTAVYKVPKSFSNKKKNQALAGKILPEVKPDLDNVLKVVCDGLNGVAYRDDKQIVELNSLKVYGEVPRVVARLECEENSGKG